MADNGNGGIVNNEYHLLGKTGLRVSRLALGAMTFGEQTIGSHDWGADEATARSVFEHYLAWGGNFIDTANIYTGGRSEELLGRFIAETNSRDQVVLATKFTGARGATNPNLAGNGRKNMLAALDASLRRLGTDYVDLYWLHSWDMVTPVEEVMSTFDTMVRSGKVRAIGLSNVPAWYLTKGQLLAEARGWERIAALQLEYSLIERSIEREHVPAALELGMGIVPWSPLGHGFLSGKYTRSEDGPAGDGRIQAFKEIGFYRQPDDQSWAILEALREIAKESDRSPAQVALNWVTNRPGVASTLVGARTVDQLDANLAALDFDLSSAQTERLDELSKPELGYPYGMFGLSTRGSDFTVSTEPRSFRV
ncbi:MAG TPA: aldo/keto reductase [Pseudonocardiaceae bacterium]|jgi:aryl-alcohol dehydrogenase-like predicted oxidoreductase|nr:aldo/keto reductase [Pseudonocardiaceae bacterium]